MSADVLGLTFGGGGTPVIPGPTTGGLVLGSVLFADAANHVGQDNPAFFWDDVNFRLGLGGQPGSGLTPAGLDVFGTGILSAQFRCTSAIGGGIRIFDTTNISVRGTIGYGAFPFFNSTDISDFGINAIGNLVFSSGAGAISFRIDNSGNCVVGVGGVTSAGIVFKVLGADNGAVNFALDVQSQNLTDLFSVRNDGQVKVLVGPLLVGNTSVTSGTLNTTAGNLNIAAASGAGNVFLFGPVSFFSGKIFQYNAISTTGWGVPAIYSSGRVSAQNAAVASIASFALPAADGSFLVSANVLVTASTTHSINVTVSYTDEGGTARVLTLTFSQITGVFLTAITNVQGSGAYEGVPLMIRVKASTTITIGTSGTFTSVTYNAEGCIQQVA